MSRFSILFDFSFKPNNQSQCSINNHAEFVKSVKFHENPLQTHGNIGPRTQLPIFTKKCISGDKHFFVKIGKFGVRYFHEFAKDFRETSHIFNMMNEYIEVVFLYTKNTKNCSYFVEVVH